MRSRSLLVLVAVSAAVIMTIACGQFNNVLPFKIENNTKHSLVFSQCGNTCHEIHEVDTVQPHGSIEYNQSDADIPEWILISTTSGLDLGCVTTQFGTVPPNEPVDKVINALPCPLDASKAPSLWDQAFG